MNLVVIDEADRMADMGFLPEVRRLLDKTNPKRQTMLFSATLDGDVDVLIRRYQTNPVHHEAHSMEEQGEVTHRFWAVSHADRIQVATAIVERSWPAIVFSRTRHGAERLSKQLRKAGIRAEAIHGDRSQSQRERALAQFGRGDVHVLVATDVAARGIHVDGVACVLQFDPPGTDKDYVHRSGRTGRAGEAGTVITFVPPEKEKDVRKMQRELRRREPIEAATVATAATVLASTPPKPIDRGDDLDGVSRRDRARTTSTASPISVVRPPPVAGRPTARAPARGRWRRTTGPPGPSPASPRPPRAATDRSVPGPRHALVAPAPSPADDPLVQEPPVRAAPPAATHADARAERPPQAAKPPGGAAHPANPDGRRPAPRRGAPGHGARIACTVVMRSASSGSLSGR